MNQIEAKIIKLIDENRETILEFGRDIYNHAEMGYKEFRTSGKFVEFMEKRNLPVTKDLAITGAKAYLNREKAENVSLALLGELDALRIPQHAHANPETQAAHCCGHHTQMAGVIGAALALTDPEVAAALDGQVIFFAVPAEEYGEVEFKNTLIAENKIQYGGGKCELLRIGAFEDISLCLAHHTGYNGISFGSGSGNGFVSKVIRMKGKAAHAAGCPEKGVNALSAASLGLQALGLNRETFRDEDCVRVHPIMTKGGDLVNVVPGEVVEIAREVFGSDKVSEADLTAHSGGSTDVGDVQHRMPVLTFHTGGATGGLHQVDFDIVDEEEAYITTAKLFALSAYRLLRNGAACAKQVVNDYKPRFASREEYVAFMDAFNKVEEKIRKVY